MKIRIRANTLRLRLTQSEVQQLASEGLVEEVTPFGESQALRYALLSTETEAITASFVDGRIAVAVPRAQAQQWASDDTQVGMQAEMPTANNGPENYRPDSYRDGQSTLSILIEKDFACLQTRTGEDDKDTFPNPLAEQ